MPLHFCVLAFWPLPSKICSIRGACCLVLSKCSSNALRNSSEEEASASLGSALMSWCSASYRSFNCSTYSSRSEEHTSELQSRPHLVCRLLLEKKKRVN